MAVRGRALVEGVETGAQVVALTGEEHVSKLYAFDVVLQTRSTELSLEDLVRRRFTVELEREAGGPYHPLHGIVEKARLVQQEGLLTVYRIRVVPKLWNLTQSRHSRIFTDASFRQILEAVLADEGMVGGEYRLELTKSYAARSHVCQYKESSFDFLSRWMEREGIHYYFEHDGDHEVIVFADDNASFAPILNPLVRYAPMGDGDVGEHGANEVRLRVRRLPSTVELFDANPDQPALDVRGSAAIRGGGEGAIVRWGENFLEPGEALRDAQLRAEELTSRRERFELSMRQLGVRTGSTFVLTDHPVAAFNDELVATSVRHEAVLVADDSPLRRTLSLPSTSGYRAFVEARRQTTTFRPERVTTWPRVAGLVDATIDGASTSDYAQLDEQGRYKVTFHFDESDLVDGSRSTYVRRLQPHGGSIEGFHFPLRKGTEVSVMFLGGDPDKPVIVGAAPNVATPSKVARSNNTKNVIHTGGDNRIEMEDADGGQWVRIDCPTASTQLHMGTGGHNVIGTTSGKGNIVTGTHALIEVGATKREDVTGSLTETYNASHTLTVAGAVQETQHTSVTSTITGAVTHTITGTLAETVAATVREEFLAAFTATVTGGTTLNYQCGLELTVTAGATETFDATYDRTVTGSMKYVVTGAAKEELGPTTRTINGNYDLTVDGTYTLRCASLQGDASQWSNTDALLDGLVELYDQTHGIDIKVTGISMAAYGLLLKLYGKDSATTILSATLAGANVTLAGLHVQKRPWWIKVDGPEMATGGLDVETKAVVAKI
ncbi:MAG: type VI secretion system tip protein VgrG [Polyangiaceae bacterium]|nr:type VI secretion system tip protein VgrG [Polyangiaceae bacterium]